MIASKQKNDRLPFAIDRHGAESLTRQVESGFRRGIESGYYKAGDKFPTLKRIAESLGISVEVSRNAIRRLVEANLVTARPHHGIEVCPRDHLKWRAHVLFLHRDSAHSYYAGVLAETVIQECLAQRILVTSVLLGDDGAKVRHPHVAAVVRSGPIDLGILYGEAEDLDILLAKSDIPFIQQARYVDQWHCSRFACRRVVSDRRSAIKKTVAHILACGVSRPLIVSYGPRHGEIEQAMRSAGLKPDLLVVEPEAGLGVPANVETGGLKAMADRLRTAPLPDLVYFADDYLARGGLTAMLEHGIRIPDDVQIISLANRGSGPVFSKPLTRIEADPCRDGKTLAGVALQALKNPLRKIAKPLLLEPEFILGKTTRVREAASCFAGEPVNASQGDA